MFYDTNKMSESRQAEALTMDHERNRLKDLGIDKELQWIGLDDVFAAYDVLSYDLGAFAPINRMIAVKCAAASPLRFEVTRSEWERAQQTGAAYVFQVWEMQKNPPVLHERTVAEIAAHIPRDNSKGRWQTVEIRLDG